METILLVMRMGLLPLLVAAAAGAGCYNVNRLVILTSGARSFLMVAIVAVSAPMVVAPFFFEPVPLSKLVLAYFMFFACILCWAVLAISRHGQEALLQIEEECSELRDVSILGATQTRAQLAEISERLRRQAEPPNEREATALVLKHLSPIVMLFFAKEKSMLKWGMGAFQLARSFAKYLNAKKKNEA